ncbi:MAG: alanine/ornithine racemase family PLP-dependent enzyme [Candidatus Riflebacteria bacterium]|nr:alanine/ornithine racemase family PLP-dependent enzyme [Candidatus Riflebacteria bacterium]
MTSDVKVTPRLEIYPERIKENTSAILKQCKDKNVDVAFVTKVAMAHPAVARAMRDAGADMLADSRIENIIRMRKSGFAGPFMLLRLPALSQAFETVKYTDISLNTSVEVVKRLGEAARALRKTHKVILMVDLGDLREGVWPDKVVDIAKEMAKVDSIKLIGLGANLACYGGVIPSVENMTLLADLTEKCRKATGLPLTTICGGNSSGLPLLHSGKLPKGINLYRIGEAAMLGRNVIDRSPWIGTRQDTFIAVAEVIESAAKPSVPIGERGQDAFGETGVFEDRGNRQRLICNIGRQDVNIDGLTPCDPGIIILGGSSDHLLLDVSDSEKEYKVGDEVAFYPSYGALLALSTSEYVHKMVIEA